MTDSLGREITEFDAYGCPITNPADFTDADLFGTPADTDENNAMRYGK